MAAAYVAAAMPVVLGAFLAIVLGTVGILLDPDLPPVTARPMDRPLGWRLAAARERHMAEVYPRVTVTATAPATPPWLDQLSDLFTPTVVVRQLSFWPALGGVPDAAPT